MSLTRCILFVAAALVLWAAPLAARASTAPDSLPAATVASYVDSTVLTMLRLFPEEKYEVRYRVVEKGKLKHRKVRGRLTVRGDSLAVSHRVYKRLNEAEDHRLEIPLAAVESVRLQRQGANNSATELITLVLLPCGLIALLGVFSL